MKLKVILITLISSQLLALSSFDSHIKTENYYKLKFLKESNPPISLKMIKFDNQHQYTPAAKDGILFTYKNRDAKKVFLAGNFSEWNLLPMSRNKNGIWYYFLDEYNSKKNILYKFYIDGIWSMDPSNSDKEDDGFGSYVSMYVPYKFKEGKQVTYRIIEKNIIEFRIYSPHAKFISIVGDFNHWNPENDLLKKDKNGIWRLKKRIPSGTYRYKFIIDGTWQADIYNEKSASDDTGEVCSLLEVN